MNKYYFHKKSLWTVSPVLFVRFLGLLLFIIGITTVVYIFSPIVIWQLTLAPAFADSQITAPVPKRIVITPDVVKSLLSSSMQRFGVDYNDASNWFPSYTIQKGTPKDTSFFLTIPKLAITNAYVSTIDMNLADHLVNLPGTAMPPDRGNTVIFGHSTLPQLFNPKDYKTIFADAYKLQIGDTLTATVENVMYTYKIVSITVVDPEDTSVLAQQYDDSYLTLITCTPPGTIWKRLVLKARLQKLN